MSLPERILTSVILFNTDQARSCAQWVKIIHNDETHEWHYYSGESVVIWRESRVIKKMYDEVCYETCLKRQHVSIMKKNLTTRRGRRAISLSNRHRNRIGIENRKWHYVEYSTFVIKKIGSWRTSSIYWRDTRRSCINKRYAPRRTESFLNYPKWTR